MSISVSSASSALAPSCLGSVGAVSLCAMLSMLLPANESWPACSPTQSDNVAPTSRGSPLDGVEGLPDLSRTAGEDDAATSNFNPAAQKPPHSESRVRFLAISSFPGRLFSFSWPFNPAGHGQLRSCSIMGSACPGVARPCLLLTLRLFRPILLGSFGSGLLREASLVFLSASHVAWPVRALRAAFPTSPAGLVSLSSMRASPPFAFSANRLAPVSFERRTSSSFLRLAATARLRAMSCFSSSSFWACSAARAASLCSFAFSAERLTLASFERRGNIHRRRCKAARHRRLIYLLSTETEPETTELIKFYRNSKFRIHLFSKFI